MRALALTTGLVLLPVVVVPGTSAALTIPLIDTSTFSGSLGGAPGQPDGFPAGGGTGSITFDGDLGPNSTALVTALHFSEFLEFVPSCGGGYGYLCPLGFQIVTVALNLVEPGSLAIDGEGHASGELHVTLGSDANAEEAAATLIVNVFGSSSTFIFDPTHLTEDPRSGAFHIEGTLQFDDPGSPFASLQGVTLVPEPAQTAMLLMAMTAVAVVLASRRRSCRP